MNDKLDDAIASVEGQPAQPDLSSLITVPILISGTGRPTLLSCPPNLTILEAAELAGFVLTQLIPYLQGVAGGVSPIVAVDGSRLPRSRTDA